MKIDIPNKLCTVCRNKHTKNTTNNNVLLILLLGQYRTHWFIKYMYLMPNREYSFLTVVSFRVWDLSTVLRSSSCLHGVSLVTEFTSNILKHKCLVN